MAVVDASYKFIMVDIGDYGRLSDSSVFGSCNLGIASTNNFLQLPPTKTSSASGATLCFCRG